MHFAAADEILVAAGGCNAFTAHLKALFDTGLNQFYHRSVVLQFEILFLHVLLEFSSLADTCTRNNFVNHRGIKKEARVSSSSLIPRIRPSHCPFVEDKQCRAHAVPIYIKNAYYTPIGVGLALPCDKDSEFAKFDTPQIKRFAQRLFLLCPVTHPLTHQWLGWKTMQRYELFLINREKLFPMLSIQKCKWLNDYRQARACSRLSSSRKQLQRH